MGCGEPGRPSGAHLSLHGSSMALTVLGAHCQVLGPFCPGRDHKVLPGPLSPPPRKAESCLPPRLCRAGPVPLGLPRQAE